VLDRLEAADAAAELFALAGVADRELGEPGCEPDLQRAGEDRSLESRPRDVEVGENLARRHRVELVQRRQRVDRLVDRAARGRRCEAHIAVENERRGGDVEVRDQQRRLVRLDQRDRSVGAVAGEEGRDQRAGDGRPAQLLEDEHGLGQPEIQLGTQPEDTGFVERAPGRGVEPLRQTVEREPIRQQLAHALLQLALLVSRKEVHQRSLGSPRMRSPTMLRWICEVPAAIV